MIDRLLCDVGEHGVCPAKRHHRHLREEHGDLAEYVVSPEREENGATGTSQSDSQ